MLDPHQCPSMTRCYWCCLGALGISLFACAEQQGGDAADTVAAGGTGSSVSLNSTGSTASGNGNTSSTAGGQSTESSVAVDGNTGDAANCATDAEEKFSFFLTSRAALLRLSASEDGFGGDLGGVEGADAICQSIAEYSSHCQAKRLWHAFLSTATVNAKDRIGSGPWYDRRGRLLAKNLTDLINERPVGGDGAIVNDLPNEDGVPNHSPEGTPVDNHEILTGSGTDGSVYKQSSGGFGAPMPGNSTSCGPSYGTWSVEAATCWGWTTKEGKGCPRVGHSWPRDVSGKHWISVANEGGCAPGGALVEPQGQAIGLDGTPRVGSAGGYGGFYCFAVTG